MCHARGEAKFGAYLRGIETKMTQDEIDAIHNSSEPTYEGLKRDCDRD